MKKIVMLICLMLLITGCDSLIYEPNPTREKEEALAENEDVINEYDTTLLVIDETSTSFFVIDDEGHVFETTKIGYTGINEGMTIKDCTVRLVNDELEKISYGQERFISGVTYQFESSAEDAAINSGRGILDTYVGSSTVELALESYEISDAKVLENKGDHIKKIIVNYQVKPMVFADGWGTKNEEGIVSGLSMTYTVYGANLKWVVDGAFNITDNISMNTTTAYETSEDQKVLYEDDTYTYYQEYEYFEDGESDESDFISRNTTIRRINRNSGSETRMYSGDTNYDFYPVMKQGKDLYVYTTVKDAYGEETNGYFGILDMDRKYMTEIINEPAYYGTQVGDLIYVVTKDELVVLNAATNETEVIAELPELNIDGISVGNLTESGFIMSYYGGSFNTYAFDLETKKFVKVQ